MSEYELYDIQCSGTDSDRYAEWKDGNTCNCSKSEWHAILCYFYEVPCTRWGKVKEYEAVCGPVRRIIDGQHACVTIKYRCEKCGSEFTFTYDYSINGTRKRNGYYHKYYSREEFSCNKYFEDVDSVYNSLDWSGSEYKLGDRDCYTWAEAFKNRL